MKHLLKSMFLGLSLVFLMSSCYNSRILVGDIKPNDPVKEVNKVWNHHLIAGLVPLSNTNMNPEEFLPKGTENYVVKTNQSFLNGLVGGLTLGIYTPTQTKFYIPYE